jgi:hypothetical protein
MTSRIEVELQRRFVALIWRVGRWQDNPDAASRGLVIVRAGATINGRPMRSERSMTVDVIRGLGIERAVERLAMMFSTAIADWIMEEGSSE